MTSDRRGFLLSGPAALFAFNQFAELGEAQGGAAQHSVAVADFWSRGMGVPSNRILGGSDLNSRSGNRGPAVSSVSFAREPVFLHYDSEEKVLMPAGEIPPAKLVASGDAKVDFQLVRMRLNADDHKAFQGFSSGGIYFDMSQQEAASANPSGSSWLGPLASSLFSAFFPTAGKGGRGGGAPPSGGGQAPGGNSGSGSSGKKGRGGLNFFPQQNQQSNSGMPASTIPLQQPKQAQSVVLSGGMGKTAFAAFAKGRKKTAFGNFLDAVLSVATAGAPYLPLLNLPVVGAATLTEIRSLVGNLQQHGGDQQTILQSPPIDLAVNPTALKQLDSALRLRTGHYIAVPQEQAAAMKDQLSKLKLLNGFLVPKEANEMDLFDVVPTTAAGISYLSISINVNSVSPARRG